MGRTTATCQTKEDLPKFEELLYSEAGGPNQRADRAYCQLLVLRDGEIGANAFFTRTKWLPT